MAKTTGKFTEDEILDLYIQTVDNPLDFQMDKQDVIALFKDLSKIDGFDEYLRSLMGDDIKTNFAATTDGQRDQIRGAYRRALYFRSLLRKVRTMNELDESRARKTKVAV